VYKLFDISSNNTSGIWLVFGVLSHGLTEYLIKIETIKSFV
jgi:hypothetical protein